MRVSLRPLLLTAAPPAASGGVLAQQVAPGEVMQIDVDGQICTVAVEAAFISRAPGKSRTLRAFVVILTDLLYRGVLDCADPLEPPRKTPTGYRPGDELSDHRDWPELVATRSSTTPLSLPHRHTREGRKSRGGSSATGAAISAGRPTVTIFRLCRHRLSAPLSPRKTRFASLLSQLSDEEMRGDCAAMDQQ